MVTQFFPPETAAGAWRAGAFAAALHDLTDLHVFTPCPSYPHPSAYDGNADDFAFSVTRVGPFFPHDRRLLARAGGELRLAFRLARAALAARPDIIIASSPSMFLGPSCWFVARCLRVPCVWDVRDLTWEYAREQVERPLARLLARATAATMWATCRRVDLIVAATRGIESALVAHGVASERVVAAPNRPPRSVAVSPKLQQRHDERQSPRVLYAGLIGRNQGLDVLLDVAAHRPAVAFELAGDGPERGNLELEARRRALSNVQFSGFLDRDQLLAAYTAADVLFAQVRDTPTLSRDSIPSKLFEYMAAQRPILYAGRGAAAEMLEDADLAAVVAPADVDAIVAAVDELLADHEDTSKLVERARRYVERGPFREDVMADVARAVVEVATARK